MFIEFFSKVENEYINNLNYVLFLQKYTDYKSTFYYVISSISEINEYS